MKLAAAIAILVYAVMLVTAAVELAPRCSDPHGPPTIFMGGTLLAGCTK